MAHLQVQSTFKRSDRLEGLINKHFQKLQRFCQRIQSARVFMKKERKANKSDVVTIILAVNRDNTIAVTAKDALFEKSLKRAFTAIERKLRKKGN